MQVQKAMSFLTMFTADAAAAHGQDFSPSSLMSRYWERKSPDPMNRLSSHSSAVSTVPEEAILDTPLSPPPQKKPPRTKTGYYLAQPPPGSHAMHRQCTTRAERSLILQLQKVSNNSRPLPTFDVLPSFVLGSKLKRVGQRLHGAGQQDIVFVTSEHHGAQRGQEEDASDDEDLNSRRVVASVSQGYRKAAGDEGKGIRTTRIRFDDGLVWEANPLASGGYEFVAHESNGVMRVAKWLPRHNNSRRKSHQSFQQRTNPEPEERRYQFSILDNVTRKKPILAWLGHQSINVLDWYPANNVNSPCNSPANTPPSSILDVDMSCEDGQLKEVSEQLREFIVVTGTWVAIREGVTASGARPVMDESALPTSPTTSRSRATSGSFSFDGNSFVADEPANRRPSRHGTVATSSGSSEPTALPQRAKPTGSLAPNRLSRTLGRSQTPNIPESVLEQAPASVRPAPPVEPRQRPMSVPPPAATHAPHGASTKSFPGRNRHSTPVPLTRSPSDYLQPQQHGGGSGTNTRSPSPLDQGKPWEKKSKFSLRAAMSCIFRRSTR
jgi:hypothetical protein